MTDRRPAPPGRQGLGARLAADTVVYGVGGVANQAVAVLLVPIYARQLGDTGVGVAGVLNSTISLALMIAGLALPQAFFRWYLRESETAAQRAHVVGTTLAIRLVASLLGFALVLAAAIPLTAVLYEGAYVVVFALAAPIVLFDSFNTIPLSFLRAERRPRDYVSISLSRAVLGTVLILTLVTVLHTGVVGVAIGSGIAATVSAIIGFVVLIRSGLGRPRIDLPLSRAMLGFTLPLVPASIAGWALNLLDRPLLQLMTGSAATVGVYTLGYTAGLIANALVVQPFVLAWGAAHWEIARSPDAPRAFARLLTWFLALASGVALMLSALGTDALRFLVGPEFEQSRFIVPFSAFAYVLYGAYTIGASGLSIVGRTGIVAWTMGASAVASLLMNLALIPVFGMFGAAISTTASYAILALASGALGQRHYPIPWQLGRGTLIIVLAAVLSAAALLGPDHPLWRLGCAAAYVPIIIGLRIVDPRQLRALVTLIPR